MFFTYLLLLILVFLSHDFYILRDSYFVQKNLEYLWYNGKQNIVLSEEKNIFFRLRFGLAYAINDY